MFTPSFLALLKDMIGEDAQATVRNLCVNHVSRNVRADRGDRYLFHGITKSVIINS